MSAQVSIARVWEQLRAEVMHPDATPLQVREMRRAFYAGATAVLGFLHNNIAEMSESDGVVVLESLHQEVNAFARDVAAGRK